MQLAEFLPEQVGRGASVGFSVDEGKQDFLVCAEHVRELGGQLGQRRVAAGGLVGRTVHGICNMERE